MKHNTDQECIVVSLTESVERPEGATLEIEELKSLKNLYPLFKAINDVLGERVCLPVLRGCELIIAILPDKKLAGYGLSAVVAELHTTKDELSRNADRAEPLPHKAVVKKPQLIALLKCLADAKHHLTLSVQTADGPVPLPEPEPADFTEPVPNEDLSRTGTYLVVGIRRDDADGHRLLVTENDLHVLLPQKDPMWSWERIKGCLDETTYLVGTLVRESRATPWTVGAGIRLVGKAGLSGI